MQTFDITVVNGSLSTMSTLALVKRLKRTGTTQECTGTDTNVLTLGTTWTDTAGNAYGGAPEPELNPDPDL